MIHPFLLSFIDSSTGQPMTGHFKTFGAAIRYARTGAVRPGWSIIRAADGVELAKGMVR